MRRSEVAQLAAISVEYYTRIERGNVGGVSEDILDALALRLDDVERAHLNALVRAANSPRRHRAPRRRTCPLRRHFLRRRAVRCTEPGRLRSGADGWGPLHGPGSGGLACSGAVYSCLASAAP
ncbi:helix-turn-helix domain-containing protein [Streptomyces sp. NPDC059096]|uniref:helix-turn-helix domain-containing protein n=1 Tax=Streptomyces sp. NPDC059096 TaxID=3346727 RepID=UPI0036B9BD4A